MTIIDNVLKMKKMNGLKLSTLVLLSLSKFETMFGMEGDNISDDIEEKINDEYVNKNYYLIDDLGHKITLDNDEDIKFKINNEEIKLKKTDAEKYILTIKEKKEEKILASKKAPFLYIDNAILVAALQNKFVLRIFPGVEWGKETLHCNKVKKIGEDSMNDNYILINADNKKIEKIKDKNIVFKILTRKKYLDLKEKLKDPNNYLKNDEGKYILDNFQNPLLFEEEEEDKDLILYVKRLKDYLCLDCVPALETTINFTKDNSIKVRMAKKGEILEDDDSSKCCCGIC